MESVGNNASNNNEESRDDCYSMLNHQFQVIFRAATSESLYSGSRLRIQDNKWSSRSGCDVLNSKSSQDNLDRVEPSASFSLIRLVENPRFRVTAQQPQGTRMNLRGKNGRYEIMESWYLVANASNNQLQWALFRTQFRTRHGPTARD